MLPHPDFADVDWPRTFPLSDFTLTPLTMNEVHEDFDAVMKAAHLVSEVFGDWPVGLTIEENQIDLAWHDREFTERRSFAWIIRNAEGLYLGCFYIYPAMGSRGSAEATLWIGDVPERKQIAEDARAALLTWLDKNLPKGIALNWVTSPAL